MQGAATTVWAAISKEWEGKGGKYLENVSVGLLSTEQGPGKTGYFAHAYNEKGEKELWEGSEKLVGLQDFTRPES